MTFRVAIALVLLLGCDQPVESGPQPARPAAMHLTPREAELSALGSTIRLIAEVRDQYGQVMPPDVVNWSSDSPRVASVDASGLVTAIANGTAMVQASAGTVSRSAKVAVAQVTAKLVLEPHSDTLLVGDTLRLAAEAFDANGHAIPWAVIAWTSQDPRIAEVDASGLVTAVAEGTVVVEASTASGVTGRVEMEVVPPVPAAVSVTPDSVVLVALGASARLSAEVLDRFGRVMEGTAVVWTSGDTTVAVVDSVGVVTSVSEGTAAVTAAAGTAFGTAAVMVAQVAGSVLVTPVADTVELGDTLRLAAEAFDENGHRVAGAAFTWSSSNVPVAPVDKSGLARGAAEGTTTITASAGEASGTSEITVVNPDRAALMAFYNATDGPNWVDNENWLSAATLGQWNGVTVNDDGRVTQLRLTRNGLAGEIPPELEDLTSLQSLYLYDNALTGEIPPELGRLTALKFLNLRENALAGQIPAELGKLAALEGLELHGNGLTGPIPAELGNLDALTAMDLGYNTLTGRIPPELGKLNALRILELPGNNLIGPIPAALGDLAALAVLDLSANALTGPIPSELGKLARLAWLNLWSNELIGEIPPELGDLFQIEARGRSPRGLLDLSRNALTGSIPPELGNGTYLQWVRINGNDLNGPVPSKLLNLAALELFDISETDLCLPGTVDFSRWREKLTWFTGEAWCNDADRSMLEAFYATTGGATWKRKDGWLQDGSVLSKWHGVTADSLGRVVGLTLPANNLVGRITSVASLTRLMVLDVADNPDLRGPLPLLLTQASLGTLRFRGTGLCTLRESREWLASIPVVEGTGETCAPLSDRDILITLYDATDGTNWNRRENWLTDQPLEAWQGVAVNHEGRVIRLDTQHFDRVTYINGNNLTGEIPPELGGLSELRRLVLSGNSSLTGEIPPELGKLAKLEVLSLDRNGLTGEIPPELGNLTTLRELNVSRNRFTGEIPQGLGNLATLEILSLGGTSLTGEIPSELGDLATLRELYLSGSALTGEIPPELGDLATLRELYLSGNALTGEIPPELGDLATLRELHLNDNALTGRSL